MHCYKLLIAYDGTSYSGWQIQPNGPSIQEHIQNALRIILRNSFISVIGSGRTDSGVHAKGQVAHFKTEQSIDVQKVLWSLNGLLPVDIRIKQLEEVSTDFHAQYDAIGKEYHYSLSLDRVADPFTRLYGWHISGRLDQDLLQEGIKHFIGTHDFTSFTNEQHAGSAAKNPVRTLYRLDIVPNEGGICLEFEGNGFLYKMVRNIVGTLVCVGIGKMKASEIPIIFEARDRKRTPSAAPPHGLCLMKVYYS
jgi:tRNA pseudouridine38-40 synthase